MPSPFGHVDAAAFIGSWPLVPYFSNSNPAVLPGTLLDKATILGARRESNLGFNVVGRSFDIWIDAVGPITVTFSGSNPLNLDDVIAQINAGVNTTYGQIVAYRDNGFLRLRSATLGESSYLKIDTDPLSSPADVFFELGLFAGIESKGGQVVTAPTVDPDRQASLPGQYSVAFGEDLSYLTINRSLFQLAVNVDQAYGNWRRGVAKTTTKDVAISSGGFTLTGEDVFCGTVTSGQPQDDTILVLDQNGNEAVVERATDLDTSLALDFWYDVGEQKQYVEATAATPFVAGDDIGDFYVAVTPGGAFGTLEQLKILEVVSSSLAVVMNVDSDGNEVEVGTFSAKESIANGIRRRIDTDRLHATDFLDAPAGSSVINQSVVQSTYTIDRVERNNRIFCDSAAFITGGSPARVGDQVVISGHDTNAPYSNNGTYRVLRVIDDKTLELQTDEHGPAVLNPVSVATYGSASVQTDGSFYYEPYVQLSFTPPSGTYRVVFKVRTDLQSMVDDVGSFAQAPSRYAKESEYDIQRVVKAIIGPSATSFDEYLYDDKRNSLENLYFRINQEHDDAGRHTIVRADQLGAGVFGANESPETTAHIKRSDVGISPNSNTTLTVESASAGNYLSFLSGDTAVGGLLFGDVTHGNADASLYYYHSSQNFVWATAGAARMRLSDVGDLTPETATQNLGTSTDRWDNVYASTVIDLESASPDININATSGYARLNFRKSGVDKWNLYQGTNDLAFRYGGVEKIIFQGSGGSGHFHPAGDGIQELGLTGNRWGTVWSNRFVAADSGDSASYNIYALADRGTGEDGGAANFSLSLSGVGGATGNIAAAITITDARTGTQTQPYWGLYTRYIKTNSEDVTSTLRMVESTLTYFGASVGGALSTVYKFYSGNAVEDYAVGDLRHYFASGSVSGTGSIDRQYGLLVQGLDAASDNYGAYVDQLTNDGSNDYAFYAENGRTFLDYIPAGTVNRVALFARVRAVGGASGAEHRAAQFEARADYTGINTGALTALRCVVAKSDSFAHNAAIAARATLTQSGTTSGSYAVYYGFYSEAAPVDFDVTDLRHFNVFDASGGGAVTTQYGLYIANRLDYATGTNFGIRIQGADPWSLYIDQDNAHFGGNTGFGATANLDGRVSIGTTPSDTAGEGDLTFSTAGGTTRLFTWRVPAGNGYLTLDHYNFSSVWNTALVVTRNAGNVGIGGVSPDVKLHVACSGGTDGIFLEDISTTSSSPVIRVRGQRGADGNIQPYFSGRVVLEKLNSNTKVVDNQTIGAVIFGGNHTDTSEGNISYPCSIAAEAEGDFNSVSDMPTALVFNTGSTGLALNDSGAYGTPAMRIGSNGNVAIGTSSTSGAKLTVSGDIASSVGYTGTSTTGLITIAGGVSANNGGRIVLYGGSHATNLDDITYIGTEHRWAKAGTGTSLYFDADNKRLCVGDDIPLSALHVYDGDAGAVSPNTNSTVTVESDGTNYLTFLSPLADVQGLVFGDPTNNNAAGRMIYVNNDQEFIFYTQSSARLRLNADAVYPELDDYDLGQSDSTFGVVHTESTRTYDASENPDGQAGLLTRNQQNLIVARATINIETPASPFISGNRWNVSSVAEAVGNPAVYDINLNYPVDQDSEIHVDVETPISRLSIATAEFTSGSTVRVAIYAITGPSSSFITTSFVAAQVARSTTGARTICLTIVGRPSTLQ